LPKFLPNLDYNVSHICKFYGPFATSDFGTKLAHESHVGSVKELLAKEKQAREMHLGSVQELLRKEKEAR